ncbi:MAG: carbamoyl phosphate synthase small subunit [Clostridiales bacterium 43-6]|nr:MAG: carbamoyl phosphate synthase small subunit [Clostridiales bacterium 43-6]
MKEAYLILADGTTFKGYQMGAFKETICEIVFNTSMTGYVEILSDPSYAGQGVVMSYPMIGNYGVNFSHMESVRPWLSAFIVREISNCASSFSSEIDLNDFLIKYDIPCLVGVDTRAIIRHIREFGAMNGVLTEQKEFDLEKIKEFTPAGVVKKVTGDTVRTSGEGYKIAMMDFGAKSNIVRSLEERGCEVVLFPAETTAEDILAIKPDGIMLSNGPGDPKDCDGIIEEIAKLCKSGVPIFAICLGHQLIALAKGADTYKLKYGHRGANHPVRDVETGKIYITSQNHSYAVHEDNLPPGSEISHINVTDNTVEGLYYREENIFSVQYHPEACAGPLDSKALFDRFIHMIEASKQ